jgi:glutamate formiminotransferase / 5-formyltetrahydrofolate cyclo-ligase
VLLAVPNFSEGRDEATLRAIGEAFGPGLIHASADADHHRAVYTVEGEPGALAESVLAAARVAVERIDLTRHEGVHPRVGAIDVAPIVHLDAAERGAACAEALVLADRLGHDLQLPVFLYGALAGGRTRAELRRGGPQELQRRIDARELAPDAGPRRLHPTAGAVLVAARPPLAAFNVAVDTTLAEAKAIAATLRETLPGVKALGLQLERAGIVQVSTNIEDLAATTPGDVVRAVRRRAPVLEAELIAPAPRAAFASFPADVPLRGAPLLD